MLTDDLFGLIAFDLLSSGIPACHMTGNVQQEDRIVCDGINEQGESFGLVLLFPAAAKS